MARDKHIKSIMQTTKTSRRINSTTPAATLAQRLASMSETQLMFAARELAKNPAADAACTAVLEALEARAPGAAFEAFVAEIFA